MSTRGRTARFFTAALALLSVPAMTRADLIEFTFEGEIDSVSGDVPDPWSDATIGSIFLVVYVFDSDTPDLLPDVPDEGLYAVEHLSLAIDGIDQAAGLAQISVRNLQGEDWYFAFFSDILGDDAGDVFLAGIDAFSSDALPLDLDLNSFTLSRSFELIGVDFEVHGSVNSFTRAVVPSPGGLLVLGVGVVFRARGRRGWRGKHSQPHSSLITHHLSLIAHRSPHGRFPSVAGRGTPSSLIAHRALALPSAALQVVAPHPPHHASLTGRRTRGQAASLNAIASPITHRSPLTARPIPFGRRPWHPLIAHRSSLIAYRSSCHDPLIR